MFLRNTCRKLQETGYWSFLREGLSEWGFLAFLPRIGTALSCVERNWQHDVCLKGESILSLSPTTKLGLCSLTSNLHRRCTTVWIQRSSCTSTLSSSFYVLTREHACSASSLRIVKRVQPKFQTWLGLHFTSFVGVNLQKCATQLFQMFFLNSSMEALDQVRLLMN